MAQAGNFLENKIAAKLFSNTDFSIPNWYGALCKVPAGTDVENETIASLYGYELDQTANGGYTGRFQLTWNVNENYVTNSNTVQWNATGNWSDIPTHVFVYDSLNLNAGDLLFYAQIPGMPGAIVTDDVLKLKPGRVTITIE